MSRKKRKKKVIRVPRGRKGGRTVCNLKGEKSEGEMGSLFRGKKKERKKRR